MTELIRNRQTKKRQLPDGAARRLARYVEVLGEFRREGKDLTSSRELASRAGVSPHEVRKDLSRVARGRLGPFGAAGIGYQTQRLLDQLGRITGLTRSWRVAIVGCGGLGTALASYGGFERRGFEVVAAFDSDPCRVGQHIGSIAISDSREMSDRMREAGVEIAIIATPASAAEGAALDISAAGVTCILNFAPCAIDIEAPCHIRNVDLSEELQILALHAAIHASP